MLEKLSVLALPLIALAMLGLLIYALWPNSEPPEPGASDEF